MSREQEHAKAIREIARLVTVSQGTVACVESCTGGRIASAMTALPGSSHWFTWGVVSYSNEAKRRICGVPEALLAQHGAVSEEVVSAMAEFGLCDPSVGYCLATSGIAGPDGGSPLKPVGTVWTALAQRGKPTRARMLSFQGCSRKQIMYDTVACVLQWLIEALRARVDFADGGSASKLSKGVG